MSLRVLSTRLPKGLSFPRPLLGRLFAARSGHEDFAAYHKRFHHEDAELQRCCGKLKTPDHFATCTAAVTRFNRFTPANCLNPVR